MDSLRLPPSSTSSDGLPHQLRQIASLINFVRLPPTTSPSDYLPHQARRVASHIRRHERLEAAAEDAEHAAALAEARARHEAEAALERHLAATAAHQRWISERRSQLPAWRASKRAQDASAQTEAARRAEAERDERRARLEKWRRAKDAAADADADAAAGRPYASMEVEAAAAAAALELDWGSDAELEARLTAHELAVMRLAAVSPTALDDGVGGQASSPSSLLLGTQEGGDAEDDVTGATARLAPPRFLAPHERSRQVALVSYPRSGNSLLRSLLESCTGILTGSDGHADAPLSRDLAAFGLAAEGISDGRVWLVKSHWPERRGATEVRSP